MDGSSSSSAARESLAPVTVTQPSLVVGIHILAGCGGDPYTGWMWWGSIDWLDVVLGTERPAAYLTPNFLEFMTVTYRCDRNMGSIQKGSSIFVPCSNCTAREATQGPLCAWPLSLRDAEMLVKEQC